MKKTVILFLAFSMILTISGCKTQKELLSETLVSGSDLSEASSEILYNNTNNSISHESSNASKDTSLDSPNQEKKPESTTSQNSIPVSATKPTACQHSYRQSAIEEFCTKQGSVKYVCTKCKASYTEKIPAQHDYSKYLCERCGKIDPSSDKLWAMNAWLSKYGQPNGKGNMNCYPNDISALNISNYLDQNGFFIDYNDFTSGEYYSFYIEGADYTFINFSKGSTRGSAEIKNSALSSALKIEFDEFYTPEENPIDKDVFATECAKKIDFILLKAQNEILLPKTGLKLADFGLRCYQ